MLVFGYRFIRQRRVAAHKACMLGACAASALFLVSYVSYHFHAGSVRFPGRGLARGAYLAILISHTVLAVLVPPLAVRALYLAFRERFEQHARLARVAFPIWLYVSVTGVAVYAMLYLASW